MENLLVLFSFIIFTGFIIAEDVDLFWLSGKKTANISSTVFGPGSRSDSGLWYSFQSKKAYLFGGLSFNTNTYKYEPMNDIWELDVHDIAAKPTWKELKPTNKDKMSLRFSSSVCGIADEMMVVFGGVESDGTKLGDTWIYTMKENSWEQIGQSSNNSLNHPSARTDATLWCLFDQMIIFGGRDSQNKALHDMWSFSLVDLKWTEMTSSKKYPKNHFGRHIVSYPKPRSGATAFTGYNVLYMFGGNVATTDTGKTHVNGKYVTDLWKYDMKGDNWEKLGGNDQVCQPGKFSKLDAELKDNWPGCRIKASGWTDSRGNLWMFGGEGADCTSESVTIFKPAKLLNDLWQYDFTYNMWIWRGGNKYGNTGGKYGSSSSDLMPGARTSFMSFNTFGNFQYILGGTGHDTNGGDGLLSDLWQIDVHKVVIYGKYPTLGGVFMIIFGACALILLVVALSLYNRKFFKFSENDKLSNNTEYSVLHSIDD